MARASVFFVSNYLDSLHEKLKPFDRRSFSFQGTVWITRHGDALTVAITPLEKISIAYDSNGQWGVDFAVNDADDRGRSWSQKGNLGHVLNSFRGYLLNKLAPLLSDEELRTLTALG